MLLLISILSSVFAYAATMELHIGVVTQDNTPTVGIQYNTMIKALAMFKDFLKKKNNVIGDTTVNITWHMADGQRNTTELRRIGPALVHGTWNDTYYNGRLVTHAYSGIEPPMAPCDILMIEAWSDMFPSFLEGLGEAGIRVPVYGAGSTGRGVYLNDDGSAKWDFVVQALELGDKSFSSILHEIHLLGGKSVVVLEDVNGGAYVSSVADNVLTFSRDRGLQVVLYEKISFENCELLLDANKLAICYNNVFQILEKYLKPLKAGKRVRSYHADIFALAGPIWMCDDVMYAIYKLLINFKAIVLPPWCPTAKKPLLKDLPRYVKDFDYAWSPTGFSSKMSGIHFDESFSSAAMFIENGLNSPSKFVEQWYERWGPDPGHFDYQHACTMAAFYYLWRDIAFSGGVKSKIIKQFDDYRAPITSYMGLLGSKPGGWNPFHKYLGLQSIPNVDPGSLKGYRVVAPAEYAERLGVFPLPYWQDRACLPKECDKCPKCTELLRIQWIVYIIIESPLFVIAIGLCYLWYERKFNILASLSALASVAILMFKNSSNFIAVYILFLRYDVGEINDQSNAIFQSILISISTVFTLTTMYTNAVIGVYKYQQHMLKQDHKLMNPKSFIKVPRMLKLIVMEYIAELRKLVVCIPDVGITITQVYAVIVMNEVTSALMLAFFLNAYGIGGSLKSLTISNLIGECGEYEGLPMKNAITSKIKAESALNPFYTAFKFMKDVLVEWRRGEFERIVLGDGEKIEDTSEFKAMKKAVDEISRIKTMSEIETLLLEVGEKAKEKSTWLKQKSL